MRAGWGAFVVCIGASACSVQAATATAYVNTNTTCMNVQSSMLTEIGEIVNNASGLPETVPNGTLINGHPITVECTVTDSGGTFNLNLYANDNVNGTTIITGSATSSGSSTLSGVFETVNSGAFDGTNCTLTFTFDSVALPTQNPLAAGQIWGHVSCPDAAARGMVQDTDAGSGAATCDIESDILFENCTQ